MKTKVFPLGNPEEFAKNQKKKKDHLFLDYLYSAQISSLISE
jgi:hypothetical protein